ncbi:MAG TPA: histidine utilization repressor [Acidobacteria bacterium]|nr:histidine utilization repressor [Acidobacteriota bacterium]
MTSRKRPPAPLYEVVKRHVLDRIDSGRLQAGERIPSEHELTRRLKVSRMTVNRAIRELSSEGRVVRIAGVGSFVATPAQAHPLELRNVADDIRARGGRHASRVVELGKVRLDPEAARTFDLPPGRPMFHSVIVHAENGLPVQLEERYVDPHAAPDYLALDLTEITASEYLARVAPIQEVEHVVQAVMPTRRVRRLLKMPAGEPCLTLLRWVWAGGALASTARLQHPGTRYRLGGRFEPAVTSRPRLRAAGR